MENLELTGEGSGGAGTGENLTFFTGEKVTFFTGGRSLTEGPGREAGIRRGQPRTGGTPGTTGVEEKTGLSLSTDTESCFSLRFEEQKISRLVGELSKVLCRAEITEAWMRHLAQTSTPPPLGLLRLRLRGHLMSGRS